MLLNTAPKSITPGRKPGVMVRRKRLLCLRNGRFPVVGFGSVGAMDYFDPLAAVQAEHAPNGFDNLIDFQECKDPECGQMPDKHGQ